MEVLKKRKEFLYVSQKGISFPFSGLVVACAPTENQYVRYGFVASKRIGGAVARNRARRRMKECVRLFLKTNNVHLKGFDCVLIARHRILTEKFVSLSSQLEEGTRKCLKSVSSLLHK